MNFQEKIPKIIKTRKKESKKNNQGYKGQHDCLSLEEASGAESQS